jgi:predicted secreted protein
MPKPTKDDEEKPGVHYWELTLPASGKQTIALSYRLKHPVDFLIDGL